MSKRPAKMQAGGIQDTFLGIDYQFKLLELFAHRSVQTGKKFKLFTELTNVGKFDDVVFEVLEKSGNSRFIFGQAKHKKDSKIFTYEIIMDSKEFRLSSYFDSLLGILPQKKYKNTESILIITNNKIDDSVKEANGLVKMDLINKQSCIYFIEDTSDSDIFKDSGKRFMLPDATQYQTENLDIFKNLRSDFVARKLVEFLLTDYNKNMNFCRQNRKFLFDNIFDETKMEFRDKVLDGIDSKLDAFRSAFEQTFEDIENKKNPKKIKINCWDFWKNQSVKDKLQLIGSSSDANADTDQDNFDKNLKLFMKKLVLVTDLKIEDIENIIKADLEVKCKLKDVRVPYGIVEKRIKNLITKRGNSIQPITDEEYEKVFEVFELFRDKIIVVRETERYFENSLLVFESTHQDILNFLDLKVSQPSNILHIRTQPLETRFLNMQIYSKLSAAALKDTFIIMKTSLSEADFKRGIGVFKLDDLCQFLIIELDSDSRLFDDHKDCLEEILQNSSKRMIVISDVNSKVNLNKCQYLEMSHIYPKDLKIQNQVLNQSVNLQNYETTWIKLMSRDFFLNNVLLSDLLNTKSIAENVQVSKIYDKDLYISRIFEYKNILKPDILKEEGNDEFVYNKQEFETRYKSDPDKNVHWLEQSADGLKWIKSSKDISKILKFIDEGESKETNEDLFAEHLSRVSILVDVAGMGKSTVFNYLAQHLKKKNLSKWIIKIDLNDYTEELDKVELKSLKAPEQALGFLIETILKFDSEFDKILFKQSCEVIGNVILLFDGFDEVASYYKDEVCQLIKLLLETLVEKIFIATRPEWATYLEGEFKQIKHSLKPFSKEDQEIYLYNFMKKKIENADVKILLQIIQRILETMAKSLNDQDYKITGVALITKLVAEFFETKIFEYFKIINPDLDAFIYGLKSASFNLFTLYQYFFDKSLTIYFKDKSKMDPTNARIKKKIEKEQKEILENYQKVAIQQILKTDHKKHLPTADAEKLDEDEMEVLIQVGLINKDRKFVHQTYGEFCFSKFLNEHFDDEDCSKFVVEVVLVNRSYRIIRSFINFWFCDKSSEKTFEIYRGNLLASSRKDDKEEDQEEGLEKYKEEDQEEGLEKDQEEGNKVGDRATPLHVAGREGKENIFWFLYSSLTKTKRFESEKREIEAYLMKISENSLSGVPIYTAFVYYFQNCEDNLNILDQIKKDFGLDFLKEIFTIEMFNKENLLYAICREDLVIVKVFNFLIKNFSYDLKFLKKTFLSTDWTGKSFLLIPFSFSTNEILLKLFDELVSLKTILGQSFIDELILFKQEYFGNFLSNYSTSKYFDNKIFIEFLNKSKLLCGQGTMKKILMISVSKTLLHEFCEHAKDFNLFQTIQWINQEFGKDFLMELFELKDRYDKKVFHYFTSAQSNFGSQFLTILKFLKHDLKFDKVFVLNQIFLNDDRDGKNVFFNIFIKSEKTAFYLRFFELLEHDFNLTQEELKNYLIKSKFLFLISQNNERSIRDEILNKFVEKFGKTFFSDNFYSNEILHEICEKYSNDSNKIINHFNFIEEQNYFDFLKNYISGRNSRNQTILFYFRSGKYLTEILNWFKTKFGYDRNFLENFLLQVDDNGDSFLMNVLLVDYNGENGYFTETLNFLIKNFDQNFVRKFFMLKNDENKNFLQIFAKKHDEKLPRMLDLLLIYFKTDQDFFVQIINEELKNNEGIKNWMKTKLNIDLGGN